jgi:TolB-like protein
MTGKHHPLARVVAATLGLLLLSCAPATRIYLNPDADMAFYTRIAVLPFSNLSSDGLAGARVTRAFITSLIMTDRYQIVQPEEFRAALQKGNVLPESDGTYDLQKLKEVALQLGATGVLRGAVSEYTMQRSENGDIPALSFDAELLDANTGNVVWRSSIARRGKSRIPVFGGNSRSLGRLTQDACDELVARLRRGAI